MNVLISTLFGLMLASLFCALTYLRHYCDKPPSEAKGVIKTLSVSLLALISLFASGPLLLTAALGLGSTGDYLLAKGEKRAFLSGLISFAFAHLAYTLLMAAQAQGPKPWFGAIILIIFGTVMGTILFRRAGDLRWPVMGYIVIIVLMGLAAFSTHHPVLIIAATLFIISDAVLSAEMFVLDPDGTAQKITPYIIWTTYFSAQALFLYGFIAV